MIGITLICLGKLKESYLRDAVAEYSKRLSAFCRLKTVELIPCRLSDDPSQAEIDRALGEEGRSILAAVPDSSFVCAMCIEGKKLSSEELAAKIEDCGVRGFGNITFVIGSSYGLSDEVKRAASLRLSMSDMTFPHQLARVMLLEQIYRAFRINNGGKYHK